MNSQQNRLPVLDSLRGLAAIYVVLFHTALVPTPALFIAPGFERIVLFGGTGVFLFFVISGFSLSMTMGRHLSTVVPIVSYGTSRVFRIAPLFYFLLLASIIRDSTVFHHFPGIANIGLNAAFMFNFVPRHQEGIVWASWTIGVEVVYYAMFPLTYRMSVNKKLIIAGCALTAYWMMNKISMFDGIAYFSVLGFVPVFIFGELGFLAYSRLRLRSDAHTWGATATICGAALLGSCIIIEHSGGNVALRFVIAFGYSLLLPGLCLRPVKILEGRLVSFYGRISYSLYLCHAPIVFALTPLYRRVFETVAVNLAYPVCAAITLAIVTPVAWLSYQCIERPGIRLGAETSRRLQAIIATRRASLTEAVP